MLNSGWIKEDHEAPLAFRGMEEKLCIFNQTQGVVARYRDPPQIMSCRDVSSGYACQSSRRLIKEARARSLGQEDLEKRFPNWFSDDSKDCPCNSAISRCTGICTWDDMSAMLQPDMLIRTSLWAFITSESESRSGGVVDKLSLRCDMMRSRGTSKFWGWLLE